MRDEIEKKSRKDKKNSNKKNKDQIGYKNQMNTLRYKIKKSSKDIKSKTNSKQKNNDQN